MRVDVKLNDNSYGYIFQNEYTLMTYMDYHIPEDYDKFHYYDDYKCNGSYCDTSLILYEYDSSYFNVKKIDTNKIHLECNNGVVIWSDNTGFIGIRGNESTNTMFEYLTFARIPKYSYKIKCNCHITYPDNITPIKELLHHKNMIDLKLYISSYRRRRSLVDECIYVIRKRKVEYIGENIPVELKKRICLE